MSAIKMTGRRCRSRCALLLLLLIAFVTLVVNQQVARASAEVEPFDDNHLPDDHIVKSRPRKLVDGLGQISHLDTYLPASGLSYARTTLFHIQARRTLTQNIEFKNKSPKKGVKSKIGWLLSWFPAWREQPSVSSSLLDAGSDYQYDLDALARSNFDVSKRTIVMIPGLLTGQKETDWQRKARELWLELLDHEVNVIEVNWPMADTLFYSNAVANTAIVARQITIFLHYLAQLGGTSLRDLEFLNKLHLIGHSLGAHIAAFVGQDLGGHVGRITGLDPAGPSFDCYPEDQRLDRSDAQLVEVMHTNAGTIHYLDMCASSLINKVSKFCLNKCLVQGDGWLGISAQIGHIDYYANNGRTQDGCDHGDHECHHSRAHAIYVDVLGQLLLLRRASSVSSHPFPNNRLWAFKAVDYEEFRDCESRLQSKVPLLDLVKPVQELIAELRDNFNINFAEARQARAEQPRFYFRTNDQGSICGRSSLMG